MSSLVGGKWVKVSECGQCVGHWRTLSVCCYCTRNLAASLPNLGCPHFAFLPASSSSSVNTIRKIEFLSLSHTHTLLSLVSGKSLKIVILIIVSSAPVTSSQLCSPPPNWFPCQYQINRFSIGPLWLVCTCLSRYFIPQRHFSTTTTVQRCYCGRRKVRKQAQKNSSSNLNQFW